MASDLEDDDLEALRIAALATLKPKSQPIQQVITSISGVSRSPWNEFAANADVVPEHYYIPEPLPEPNLTFHSAVPNVSPWAINNGISLGGGKNFRTGSHSNKRHFNSRSHHRSFGDRGRPIHDRGRYPRRGYVSERGRGLFLSARGRGTGLKGLGDADSAGGNLIVINPKVEERKENFHKGNETQASHNAAAQSNITKLILPQDKYHLPAASGEKLDWGSSTNSPSSKPRDKFSRYDDSGSDEEDDDWLDTSQDNDAPATEQGKDLATLITDPNFEVEIRKLEFSDQEEDEEMSKKPDDSVACLKSLISDDESVDLDVLASENQLLGDDLIDDKNVVILEEDKLDSETDLDVLIDLPDDKLRSDKIIVDKVSDTVFECDTAVVESAKKVRSASLSSSSSSSSDLSSYCNSEVEDKAVNAMQGLRKANSVISAHPSGHAQKACRKSSKEIETLDDLLLDMAKHITEDPLPSPHRPVSPHRLAKKVSPVKTLSPIRTSQSLRHSVYSPVPPTSPLSSQHRPFLSHKKSLSPCNSPGRRPRSPHRSLLLSHRSRSKSPRTKSPVSLKYSSPRRHSVSPMRKSVSPSCRPFSPRRRSISPRGRSISPRRRSVLPRRSISPRRRSITHRRRSISPMRRLKSPRSRSISPRRRSITPRRRSISPRRRSISSRRSFSPRCRSVSPRRRSISPRCRSVSPRLRSISPRHRTISPKRRSISPRLRSNSPRRKSISPGHRSVSPRQRLISPKRRSMSPRRHYVPLRNKSTASKGREVSPRRKSVSPYRSPKRSGSPKRISSKSPHRPHLAVIASPSYLPVGTKRSVTPPRPMKMPSPRHAGFSEEQRRGQNSKVYRDARHNERLTDNKGYNRGDKDYTRVRNSVHKTSQSNSLKDTPSRSNKLDSHGSNLKERDKKLEESITPPIDLDKLHPEERAKIEARMKKFYTSEVKIDPAKKVSLKSIKERPKKRKQSKDTDDMSVKKSKSSAKKKQSNDCSSQQSTFDTIIKEVKDSDGKELGSLGNLEDESDDSDNGRAWRKEGSKAVQPKQNYSSLKKTNDFNNRRTGRGLENIQARKRLVESYNGSREHKKRKSVERSSFSDKRLSRKLGHNLDYQLPSKKNSSVVLPKSLVIPKHLRIEVQVVPVDKSKKSKLDFPQVRAKGRHESQEENDSQISPEKAMKKKKDKKKSLKKALPDSNPLSVTEVLKSSLETTVNQAHAPPRPSVLDRLGKKVPLKLHKEKKKKKQSQSDDEDSSELDVKIQKIKAKNEAIARRQREIELDKEKYG